MLSKEEQFNKIVSDNNERILRICNYYNPNQEDQKDMYQEVLVNIWKSLDNFRGESALNTWVYRVAVNTSLSFTGKSFKKMKLIINTETENLDQILEDDEIKEKLKQEKQFEILQSELNTLSIIDKTIVSLMLEGLTMREIADIIGITEPNVRVKIHRIKKDLRVKLENNRHE